MPALIATGASGFAMAGPSPKGVLASKLKRMRLIAGNGMLVLVPSVLFLAWKAAQGEFDAAFIAVQIVEFAAGSANLVLMGLNIRDGLRMTGRLRTAAHVGAPAPEPAYSSHSVMNAPFSWMSMRLERAGAKVLEFVRRAGRRDQDLAGARLDLGVAEREQARAPAG